MFPPKTAKDRLQILRLALQKTVVDPDFLAEAKKSKMVVGKVTGDDIERSVEEILTITPAIKNKLMVLSPGKTTTN